MIITSLTNTKIKEICKLKEKKYRNMTNTFLIEGINLVTEAGKSNLLKEIFVLDKLNGKLIKTNKSILNENNQLSTLRFYTSQPTDFVALGFASLYTQLIQESNLDNIDELMDEVTEINSEDDVYAEEEVK